MTADPHECRALRAKLSASLGAYLERDVFTRLSLDTARRGRFEIEAAIRDAADAIAERNLPVVRAAADALVDQLEDGDE